MYKNHHQIYTHSPKHGVVIGQYWSGNGFWGRVSCITERGYVVLDPLPKLCRKHKIHIDKLIVEGKLEYGVFIHPYERVNGSVGIQVFAINAIQDNISDYWVWGELRREYTS